MTITRDNTAASMRGKSLDLVHTTQSMEEGQVVDSPEYVAQHNNVVFNQAIDSLGFGRYQWEMFFTCGFGFLVDQVSGMKQHHPSLALLTPCTIDARGLGWSRHSSDYEAMGCEVPEYVDSIALRWVPRRCPTVWITS
jgi:hypothetical protein